MGLTYWMNPSIDSGILLAALLKSTSGMAVTGPASISSAMPTPSTRRRASGRTDSLRRLAPNQSDNAPNGRLM